MVQECLGRCQVVLRTADSMPGKAPRDTRILVPEVAAQVNPAHNLRYSFQSQQAIKFENIEYTYTAYIILYIHIHNVYYLNLFNVYMYIIYIIYVYVCI